jgi:hypothetical protein
MLPVVGADVTVRAMLTVPAVAWKPAACTTTV